MISRPIVSAQTVSAIQKLSKNVKNSWATLTVMLFYKGYYFDLIDHEHVFQYILKFEFNSDNADSQAGWDRTNL